MKVKSEMKEVRKVRERWYFDFSNLSQDIETL